MIDVHGTSLSAEDKEILEHPLVGGLILFTRNYESPQQLIELTSQIKTAAKQGILIAVDHEGGRVQRFRDGFSAIPAMGKLWLASGECIKSATRYAKSAGQLMALEVQAVGIDISFAPVLDVNGISEVIGDRAFHQQPDIIIQLAKAFIEGMNSVGMKATGKHFPGHGSVQEDSHIALPVDNRSAETVFSYDMAPFAQLINHVAAVMPAHVIFPDIDANAVGFSRKWLQQILRQQLGFNGVIFSDDLSMAGASVVGGFVERAEAAQQAGCDMLLACNNRDAAINIIDKANIVINKESQLRLALMLNKSNIGKPVSTQSWADLKQNWVWQQANNSIRDLHEIFAK